MYKFNFAGVGAGNYSGTLSLTSTNIFCGGNITLSPTMTISTAGTFAVYVQSATTATITSNGKTIFDTFPNVQFYDYTKNYTRFRKVLPSNYHLTFSRSEINEEIAIDLLRKGNNVAMVFDKLPETYLGYKVVNGDETDLRFLDEKNVVVGLKYKKMTGKGANNNLAFDSGFAIRTQPIKEKVVKLKKVA